MAAANSAPAELDALFAKEQVTAYIGFDCTAKSMHIGNLVQLMTLRRLQQAGHRPILLMGGGTTKAGDPSGKDETRLILSPEQIDSIQKAMPHCRVSWWEQPRIDTSNGRGSG